MDQFYNSQKKNSYLDMKKYDHLSLKFLIISALF